MKGHIDDSEKLHLIAAEAQKYWRSAGYERL
jgi:hypothetical protein